MLPDVNAINGRLYCNPSIRMRRYGCSVSKDGPLRQASFDIREGIGLFASFPPLAPFHESHSQKTTPSRSLKKKAELYFRGFPTAGENASGPVFTQH